MSIDHEDDDVVSGFSIAAGVVIGLWVVSFLFHLGPSMATPQLVPWWAFAYYFTAIAVGVVAFLGSAVGIVSLYNRLS